MPMRNPVRIEGIDAGRMILKTQARAEVPAARADQTSLGSTDCAPW